MYILVPPPFSPLYTDVNLERNKTTTENTEEKNIKKSKNDVCSFHVSRFFFWTSSPHEKKKGKEGPALYCTTKGFLLFTFHFVLFYCIKKKKEKEKIINNVVGGEGEGWRDTKEEDGDRRR